MGRFTHNEFGGDFLAHDGRFPLLIRRRDPVQDQPHSDRPMASIGWRIVVNEGTERAACATSSKPAMEHCSGTRTPRLNRARMAPSAAMSSYARSAVNARPCRSKFSVNFSPASKLRLGSRVSGISTTSLVLIFRFTD